MNRNLFRFQYVAVFLALVLIVLFLYARGVPGRVYESATFLRDPSAQHAYDLGDVHFRARSASAYDVDLAKYWYERSLEIDPQFPGSHHQLARIAFLKGNFKKAMSYINAEINLPNGPVTPSSYYIRGLIEGYMGDYTESAKDYKKYLESDPHNWAAINDYAWVLLKGKRYTNAFMVTQNGLTYFPDNPWLLNSNATALFELGRLSEALRQVQKAYDAVSRVSSEQWLTAYPGNDPKIAGQGVEVFKKAVAYNMYTIQQKVASSTAQ